MPQVRTALASTLLSCVAAMSSVACSAPSVERAVEGDPQFLTECDTGGVWAIKVETPVTWPSTFALQGGSGTVTTWLKAHRVQQDLEIRDTASICGIDIPGYRSTATLGAETYGVRFPAALFDTATLPTYSLRGTLSSSEVGATYSSASLAVIVGATMASPATDPWPSSGAGLSQVDSDSDGKPGITGDTSGPGLSHPPVNLLRTARATRVYLAFREALTSTGIVTACSRVEGMGAISSIDGRPAINSHVLGCRRDDGRDCKASESNLLDSAAPVYAPSGNATITMVKVTPQTTCADIRTMSFAAWP